MEQCLDRTIFAYTYNSLQCRVGREDGFLDDYGKGPCTPQRRIRGAGLVEPDMGRVHHPGS